MATWSTELSVQAGPIEIAPLVEWLKRLDSAVTVSIRGPNKEGVSRVKIETPIAHMTDAEQLISRWVEDHPTALLPPSG